MILGMEDLGWYFSAVMVTEMVFFLPIILASSYFPVSIHSKGKGQDELDGVMSRPQPVGGEA